MSEKSMRSPRKVTPLSNVHAGSKELIRKKGQAREYKGLLPPNLKAWEGCHSDFRSVAQRGNEGPTGPKCFYNRTPCRLIELFSPSSEMTGAALWVIRARQTPYPTSPLWEGCPRGASEPREEEPPRRRRTRPRPSQLSRACRQLTSHAGKTEACGGVHSYGGANLRRSVQDFHCLAKGRAADRWRGLSDILDIIRGIASGAGALAYRHAPRMGPGGGDSRCRKFPYSEVQGRKRGFERASSNNHSEVGLVNHCRASVE